MTRDDKLWSELSKEERAEEKREFLESYAYELGGKPSDYQMEWESYLNQEGWTGRDERIMMKRDREARQSKLCSFCKPGNPCPDCVQALGMKAWELADAMQPSCAKPACSGACLDCKNK